jgi:hypothetical protein
VALTGGLSELRSRDMPAPTRQLTGPGAEVPGQTGALGTRLRAGNVVLRYGDTGDREPVLALARDIAGPRLAALLAAGQAVLVARQPGLRGIRALAWRHELTAGSVRSPALRGFVEYWLGRGVRG